MTDEPIFAFFWAVIASAFVGLITGNAYFYAPLVLFVVLIILEVKSNGSFEPDELHEKEMQRVREEKIAKQMERVREAERIEEERLRKKKDKLTKLRNDIKPKSEKITPIAKRMFPNPRHFRTEVNITDTNRRDSKISFVTDIGNVVIEQPHSKSMRKIEVELANRLERLNNPGRRSSRSSRSSYRGGVSRSGSYGTNAASDVGDSGSGLGDTMGGDDGGE